MKWLHDVGKSDGQLGVTSDDANRFRQRNCRREAEQCLFDFVTDQCAQCFIIWLLQPVLYAPAKISSHHSLPKASVQEMAQIFLNFVGALVHLQTPVVKAKWKS